MLFLHKFPDMTFDNSKTIISLRIKLFTVTVIVLGWIAVAYIGKIVKFPFFGMSDLFWTLILVAAWLITAFIPLVLNYQFISYSDDGDYIVIRYFSAGIVGGRKNSVEINKESFSGYRVESKLFGLVRSIILFQRFNEKVAKYPPVFISALKRSERDKLLRSLNIYVKGV
jgi:hypothetical protein